MSDDYAAGTPDLWQYYNQDLDLGDLHGTTQFWNAPEPEETGYNYTDGNACKICGCRISNGSTTCPEHVREWRQIQDRIHELIRRARSG